MRKYLSFLILVSFLVLPAAPAGEVKQAAKGWWDSTKNLGKSVGKKVKKTGKKIGQGVKETVKDED